MIQVKSIDYLTRFSRRACIVYDVLTICEWSAFNKRLNKLIEIMPFIYSHQIAATVYKGMVNDFIRFLKESKLCLHSE